MGDVAVGHVASAPPVPQLATVVAQQWSPQAWLERLVSLVHITGFSSGHARRPLWVLQQL